MKIRKLDASPSPVMDGISDWVPSKVPKPTECPPGSQSKIEVLMLRVSRGEQLWHVDDVSFAGWNSFLRLVEGGGE
jgi:hypothetical protein